MFMIDGQVKTYRCSHEEGMEGMMMTLISQFVLQVSDVPSHAIICSAK